jgi:hypothetical protein
MQLLGLWGWCFGYLGFLGLWSTGRAYGVASQNHEWWVVVSFGDRCCRSVRVSLVCRCMQTCCCVLCLVLGLRVVWSTRVHYDCGITHGSCVHYSWVG